MCINFFSFFILSSVFSLLSPLFFFFLFLSVSLSLCAALSPVMVVGWWFVFGFAGSDGVGGLCLGLPAVFGFAGCGLVVFGDGFFRICW